MKYVQFTYVDAQTGVPVSEAPAANGPSIPEGIIPTFDVESSRAQQSPIIYGLVDEGYEEELPSFVQEIDEESFFLTFKNELKERARTKRKQVERAGIEVNDVFIPTTVKSQNRVLNMVLALTNNPELESIDFEYCSGEWVTFTREQGLEIGKAVGRHTQECMSWCRSIHKQIDSMEIDINSLENAMPILEAINSFGLTDSTPEGEEPTDEE